MEAAIDELGSDVGDFGPFDRVGADDSDIVLAKEFEEFGNGKALVANFDGVAEFVMIVDIFEGDTLLHPRVVIRSKIFCGAGVVGKKFQEIFHFIALEFETGGKLPQERSELFTKKQNAGSEEIGERSFDFAETLDVGDVARTFHGKLEIGGRGVVPALEAGGTLHGIEGAIDLEGREFAGGIFELLALGKFWRIEDAAPGYVAPSRNADTDLASFGHVQER